MNGLMNWPARPPAPRVFVAFQISRASRHGRVAQLIIEQICTPEVREVEDLADTERGAGGFGSTGVAGMAL